MLIMHVLYFWFMTHAEPEYKLWGNWMESVFKNSIIRKRYISKKMQSLLHCWQFKSGQAVLLLTTDSGNRDADFI